MKTVGILTAYAHKIHIARPELLSKLSNQGVQVVVFGIEDQALCESNLKSFGIKYVQIHAERQSINLINEYRCYRQLFAALKMLSVDVLLSYGIRMVPLCVLAAQKANVPVINIINGLGTLFQSEGIKGKILRAFILPVLKLSFPISKKIIFQNIDDKELLCSLGLVQEKKCVLVNGSGVNLNRFHTLDFPDVFSFSFASRIKKEKGVIELLQAFIRFKEIYPEVNLLIAGALDGFEKEKESQLFFKCTNSKIVTYCGELQDITEIFQSSSCFVFPSYREGTPRAVLEAMACGRPVITTDEPGCRETVQNGVNGFLIKSKNVDELFNAMKVMYENKNCLRKMGNASREIAEEKFDVYRINEQIISEIFAVLDSDLLKISQ